MKISIDNSSNSAANNPPGYNCWVGGQNHGDPVGIKVNKGVTIPYEVQDGVQYLDTWYYNYGWYSGGNIEGPFQEGKTYIVPKCN